MTHLTCTRLKAISLVVLFASALSFPATTAAASPTCGPRSQLLKDLAKQYHETPVAVGLANSGALVEIVTSDDGATWTILVSLPDGTSCLLAAGEEWQLLKSVANHDPSA